MKIIVQKFGGTSVADFERINNVASIINSELNKGYKIIVVVSAMAGVTNSLISQCNDVSKLDEDDNMREYDSIISSGEIVSSSLLALKLQDIGIKAKSMQGWQVPIKTDNIHGNAKILEVNSTTILSLLKNGITPVITGFQGVSPDGDISTLGKGGSDTSAAIIAAATNAERCDIYTDVEGVYSADPRVVHNAKKLDSIDIDELCILCSSGTKILHPRAALAIKRYGFSCRILSSFNNSPGTLIETKSRKNKMENKLVTAIASNKNLLKIEIEHRGENYTKILKNLSENMISIEQTYNLSDEGSFIVTNLVDKNKCQKLLENLKSNNLLTKYDLSADISTVTIVGYGINNDSQLKWKIFDIITENNIKIIALDSSDLSLSILINEDDNEKVVKLLHGYCFS